MKKKYFLPIALIALLATGCTKEFLDRKPLDSIDDSNFWTNEANLRMHSIYYYSTYFRGYGDNDYNPVLPNMSSYLTILSLVAARRVLCPMATVEVALQQAIMAMGRLH